MSLRLAEFSAYFRSAKQRFVDACVTGITAYPLPVAHCAVCIWRSRVRQRRIDDDHLTLVAGLRTDQAEALADGAGITTVGQLAAFDGDAVAGIGRQAFGRLRAQARLQVVAREHPDLPPPYELLEGGEPGTGLTALPEPSPGDLFFDIEGDPFVGDAGLEYLLGVGWVEPDGEFGFRSFWAHTADEEKAAFEQFMDFVAVSRGPPTRISTSTTTRPTSKRRSAGSWGATGPASARSTTCSARVCSSISTGWCDSRCGWAPPPTRSRSSRPSTWRPGPRRSPTPAPRSTSTSGGSRQATTGSSRTSRSTTASTASRRCCCAPGSRSGASSTRARSAHRRRAPQGPTRGPETRPPARTRRPRCSAGCSGTTPGPPPASTVDLRGRHLLADLLDWYRREAKPEWWEYFRRVWDCDVDDLFEDTEAIAGLTYDGEARREKRSTIHRYRFDPDQEYKLAVGDTVLDPATVRRREETGEQIPGPGTLVSIDPDRGVLELKRSTNSSAPHPADLIPRGPLPTDHQRAALRRVAASVIDHGLDADGPYRAVRDLLLRRPPRTTNPPTHGDPLVREGVDGADAVVRLGLELDDGCLAVQGPPGSGKTRAAARLAVALIDAGKTVGITANSHAVITNLLDAVGREADEAGVRFHASQKSDGEHRSAHPSVTQQTGNDAMASDLANGADVLAGTAWMFAREEFDQTLDYLIVDEAGQFSLANVVAVGTAARNVVLLGDPMQLAQPSKGTHPDGAGVSALAHVLGDAETLPDDLGVFLDHTQRLHPEICAFISEAFYEGRLHSAEDLVRQRIDGSGTSAGSGLRWRPVEHADCRVSSSEEVDEVSSCYQQLLGRIFTERSGAVREIGPEDILVVAPYNAQVRLLRQALPADAQIGTVDKFQGRQASVVICSMTTSSIEEIPRGMEFLLSRNRLNVAVSRAQALAILVGSPKLLTIDCRTVNQLRMVNALCRFVELAS